MKQIHIALRTRDINVWLDRHLHKRAEGMAASEIAPAFPKAFALMPITFALGAKQKLNALARGH